MNTPAFGFVPVEPDAAVMAEPGWCDGSQPGRLSGEIRCTLKALTPLLVGCHQIAVKDATKEVQQAFRKLVGTRAGVKPELVKPDNRKILQPLMAGSGEGHSPVLLPGSSLKGMLRHALGSLLNAPMERVNERRFTHRPNIVLQRDQEFKRQIVPAVVTEVGPKGNITGIRCVPYHTLQYRWNNPRTLFSRALDRWKAVAQLSPAARKDAYTQPRPATEVCLQDGRSRWVLVESHRGLDHKGELHKYFIKPKNPNGRELPEFIGIRLRDSGDWISVDIEDPRESQRLKKRVGIPTNEIPTRLPDEVFEAYLRTQKILADEAFGHFRDHPLAKKIDKVILKKIRDGISDPRFKIGDLVFLEFNSESRKIVAMGHHLRYRWGTTDSVQRVGYLTQ